MKVCSIPEYQMGEKKHASPCARGTKKVHKPLSEKLRSCRKSNNLLRSNVKYLILEIKPYGFESRIRGVCS